MSEKKINLKIFLTVIIAEAILFVTIIAFIIAYYKNNPITSLRNDTSVDNEVVIQSENNTTDTTTVIDATILE